MFNTRITELFNIRYPIIQGGMMWLGHAELTAAVANAGGLAFMTALTHPEPEDLRQEIRKTRELTDKPFGINLTISRHLGSFKLPELIKVVLDEGIDIIETAAFKPDEYMPLLKQHGIKVVHKCTSIRHALHAQKIGVDAVSIDGFECAGMPGLDDVTSLILVPRAVDELDIPVIASGGFGDARGVVAALALGAEGVNMGTRFAATQECVLHERVKQALVNASELDTQLVMKSLKASERCLKTANTQRIVDIEAKGDAKFEDFAKYILGTNGVKLIEEGDLESGVMSAGEVVGLIHDVPSVQALFDRIVREAYDIVAKLQGG